MVEILELLWKAFSYVDSIVCALLFLFLEKKGYKKTAYAVVGIMVGIAVIELLNEVLT